MNSKILKTVNTVAFIIMAGVNIAANVIPLGIGNTGEVSRKYENLFTPAPLTFGIWGIIYLLMGLFVLYQWGIFDKGENSDIIRKQIGPWFTVSCILNTGWIFAWHYDIIWLSAILIAALMISLIIITGKNKTYAMHTGDTVCADIGFNIYYGWIIAATIANISVLLTSLKWDGFGLLQTFWTCLILMIGSAIGCIVVLRANKQLATLAIIWAYVGIIIKHASKNGYNGRYVVVIVFAVIGIMFMLTSMMLNEMYNRMKNNKRNNQTFEMKGYYDEQYHYN